MLRDFSPKRNDCNHHHCVSSIKVSVSNHNNHTEYLLVHILVIDRQLHYYHHQDHRDRRTRELARSRDTGQQSKFKMVA